MRTSMMLTDAEPIDLMRAIAQKRDRNAFAITFNSYAPKLKSFLMNGGLDRATAEELVQEIMLTVWQRADSFDPKLGGCCRPGSSPSPATGAPITFAGCRG